MTAYEPIQLLQEYGHLGKDETEITPKAVLSFQNAMGLEYEALGVKTNGKLPEYDGIIGPVTEQLFQVERCGCPDMAMEAGAGSWPVGC